MRQGRPGVVLIAVLIVVVLLALAAYQYSELMAAEAKASAGAAKSAQARALADSGIHYAAALLSDRDSFTGTLNNNPYDNAGKFQGVVVSEGDNQATGRFSLVAPPGADDGSSSQFRYGVTDESSKLNLNALMQIDKTGKVLRAALMLLPNMTDEAADSILDWIDPDDDARQNGAEQQYYGSLSPAYRCKNGPLDSLEELLLVKGVTPELLFGNDRNRNGIFDASESDGGGADRGWSQYLTVYSRELNYAAAGTPRTYLNDKDMTTLQSDLAATSLGDEMINYIIAYRTLGPYQPQPGGSTIPGGAVTLDKLGTQPKAAKNIPSILGMIGTSVGVKGTAAPQPARTVTTTQQTLPNGSVVTQTQVTVTQQQPPTTVYPCPLNDAAKRKQLLPLLLDLCTTQSKVEIPARVNVNTAPQAVLAALPGLDDNDVQAILAHRPSSTGGDLGDPTYGTPAWLITEANIAVSKVQALERYVAARSQVYRVQSLGHFDGGGPVARVEAVIDTNAGKPRIVYWRDLTGLGRGYNLQNPD